MESYQSEPFYMSIRGDYALFTDPLTKGGGEKFTYQVPTYQALKGMVEACYWKPSLYYVIEAVKIMKPFQSETHGIRAPLANGRNDLNYYTYLRDVEYYVRFHFEWNTLRPDLEADHNPAKHEQILLRSMSRGGRRDVFLGVRECMGYIDRLKKRDYEKAQTPFQGQKISFGLQFHSFAYPSESNEANKDGKLRANFAEVLMDNGEITFERPEKSPIQHVLSDYHIRQFGAQDIRSVDEELTRYNDWQVNDL